jgi:hypothetical protein
MWICDELDLPVRSVTRTGQGTQEPAVTEQELIGIEAVAVAPSGLMVPCLKFRNKTRGASPQYSISWMSPRVPELLVQQQTYIAVGTTFQSSTYFITIQSPFALGGQ